MRAPCLMLPLTLALSAPLAGIAQEGAPRVLFCNGGCFAVDAKGVRTPAPKGTTLLPGQRLETAAGGYAQVKLSRDAAVGIGEQARIRFDRNAVVLDHGRVRMVGIGSIGKPIVQPVELRTPDGVLVLRGADLEARKVGTGGAATPTLVKLNAGDARLGKGPEEIQLPTQGVHGITRGKLAGAPIPITDIVPPKPGANVSAPREPVALPLAPVAVRTPLIQPTTTLILSPTLTTTLNTTTLSPTLSTSTIQPVLTSGDKLLNSTVTTTSGTTTTLSTALIQPITTTTISPTTTTTTSTITSPTLSTTKSLTLQPTTTTTTTTCCATYTFTLR